MFKRKASVMESKRDSFFAPKKRFLIQFNEKKEKEIIKETLDDLIDKIEYKPPKSIRVNIEVVKKKIIRNKTNRSILHFALCELTQKFLKNYYTSPDTYKVNGLFYCPNPTHIGDKFHYKTKKGEIKEIKQLQRSHYKTSRNEIVNIILDKYYPNYIDVEFLLHKVIDYHIENNIIVFFSCRRCNKDCE